MHGIFSKGVALQSLWHSDRTTFDRDYEKNLHWNKIYGLFESVIKNYGTV